MTSVVDIFRSLLPPRTKISPSGWTSFNAPCCHHRGHQQDTRKRAGIRFDNNGVVYNCFNCKFSTGWQPGSYVGEKMKTLARWMNADEDTIKKLVFESMKSESPDYQIQHSIQKIDFVEKSLPEGALPLLEWAKISSDLSEKDQTSFVGIVDYLVSRGYKNPFDHDFYWTPAIGYRDRVIIPFTWQHKIVGNTARKVTKGSPKYLSDQQPHFVFNFDRQTEDQKYIFVVEGPFDAIAVNGVGLLHNEISDQQYRILESLPGEKIVVPDQDEAGLVLFDHAILHNWTVAVPNWEDDVKDCAAAVQRYGKLYVTVDAIMTAHRGPIQIAMAKQKLKHKIERLKYAEDY
jgi:hypothetical protein